MDSLILTQRIIKKEQLFSEFLEAEKDEYDLISSHLELSISEEKVGKETKEALKKSQDQIIEKVTGKCTWKKSSIMVKSIFPFICGVLISLWYLFHKCFAFYYPGITYIFMLGIVFFGGGFLGCLLNYYSIIFMSKFWKLAHKIKEGKCDCCACLLREKIKEERGV